MAIEVVIPKLGMTMTEGKVSEWRVEDGAEVQPGQVIYLLETEKIQFEVEAETAGEVRQLVPAGATLPTGAVVAYVLAPGERLPEGAVVAAGASAVAGAPTATSVASANGAVGGTPVVLDGGRVPSSPIARRLAKEAGLDIATIAGSGPGGRVVEADVLVARAKPREAARVVPALAPTGASRGEVMASPLARRLAEQLGLDLARVPGSGPGGRITKEDVERAAAGPRPAMSGQAASTGAGVPAGAVTPAVGRQPGDVIPLRGMRGIIAERMHASLQEMAQLTLGMDVRMDESAKLRAQLAEEWADEGVKPSYTDLVIKAVAKALGRHPLLNARVTEAGVDLLPEVHVGMAVALEDGLVVPVIRDADRRPLREIAMESARLAEAARGRRLLPDELAGGTFSVTSLGMYDVDFFTPIINPPNVGILGVGRIHDATGWDGDRPVRERRMTLSLTIDHRAVDGAPAAAFLGAVRDLLQAPYRLLV
jgi:pyruvate/2-oxoglutarate dehydrogenase complex dihydrolipoamide acyltransferase (E2) component